MAIAIVGGCRTPFVKAAGALSGHSFLDLGIRAVQGLTGRLNLKAGQIDEIIFGTVLLDPRIPNAARELVLRSNLPPTLSAHFVSNNCITGLVAINMIAEGIKSGRIRSGIAGGSESMSNPALSLKPQAEKIFLSLARARSLGQRLSLMAKFRPGLLMPQPPSPKEPSTGMTMGQHCEISAKEFEIARQVQDDIAFRSHQNAARAQEAGILAEEIEPVDKVSKDNIIRADTSLERLAKLSPVFDRSGKGSLTAGNSSPLTDGASAVCLMSDEEAKRQGREILGYLEAVEYAALPPTDGLLMAPGLAIPRMFAKHDLKVSDVDVFEIHEAFGAQVAANMVVWERGWNKYPDIKPIGKIPIEKININGGSIAIGHPFAATGGRLVLSMVNQLKRAIQKTGVISVCAAGGMAAAVLIRRA